MAIQSAQIKVEHVEVSLKEKPQSLLNYSPKATVPVVVTVDGKVLEQSRDIMHWALDQSDPDDWLLKDNPLKWREMSALVDSCDFDFKPLLDRYKYHDRHPEQSQAEYRQQAEFFLQKLEQRLGINRFLIDEKIRLADVAIFPFIRQFAGVDGEWFNSSRYQNLQRWLNFFVTSDLFKATMKK
jgi:glutathione S-transferase